MAIDQEDKLINDNFIPGVKQPIQQIKLTFNIPSKGFNFDFIDKNFTELFSLDCQKLSYNTSEKIHESLIERYILLANSLHSFVGIPCFDIGKINKISLKSLSKTESKLDFETYVPKINYVSFNIRSHIYNLAIKIFILILGKNNFELHECLKLMDKELESLRNYIQSGSSTIPLLKAAYDKNIPFRKIGKKVYQLGWGHRSRLLLTSTTDGDSLIGSRIANNKLETISILRDSGYPVAQSFFLQDKKNLEAFAQKLGWPIILKPIDKDRSEGVTTNISNNEMLQDAYAYSLEYSKNIMMEKHVVGDVYRIGLINNELLIVSRRLPKGVFGDGKSTIEALIDNFNETEEKKAPWLRAKLTPKDQLALNVLQDQNYGLDTVLDDGVFANVRAIQSDEEGGSPGDFTDKIHPDNIILAQRISKLFRLQSIGIDIISKDIEKPWYENGAKILEVNFTPAIANPQQPLRTKFSKPFIENFMSEDERIPISLFIGRDQGWEDGWNFYQSIKKEGTKACLINDEKIYNHEEIELHFTMENFNLRCQALLRDRDVEHLIVVIQTNELLVQGIPFDQITKLQVSETKLNDFKTDKKLQKESVLQIIEYLRKFLRENI